MNDRNEPERTADSVAMQDSIESTAETMRTYLDQEPATVVGAPPSRFMRGLVWGSWTIVQGAFVDPDPVTKAAVDVVEAHLKERGYGP